jgi:hypothetical protein
MMPSFNEAALDGYDAITVTLNQAMRAMPGFPIEPT